jgi:hypothetical protein
MRRLRHPSAHIWTRRGWKRLRRRARKPLPQPTRPELSPDPPILPDVTTTALHDDAPPATKVGQGERFRAHRACSDIPVSASFGEAASKLTLPR